MEHPDNPGFKPARLPSNEKARLAMVRRSGLMDATNTGRFDVYTRLFRHIAGVPVAYTGLIDDVRQYFLSENFTGCMTGKSEVAREETICQYALLDTRPAIIRDLRESEIYKAHPLVTGDPYWVFWAGFPVVTPEGHVLGTLCAVDFKPRDLTEEQISLMREVAEEMSLSVRLQTEQQELIAEKTVALLSDLKAHGVTRLSAMSDFLDLCLGRPLSRQDAELLATGLAEADGKGMALAAQGRAIKTGRGLGPSSFRQTASPLRNPAMLDRILNTLGG